MNQKIAFALIMGIVTTGVISFALISFNLGFSEHFLGIWLKSWAMAYTVVIPAILIIGPQVQKVVDHFFGGAVQKDSLQKNHEANPKEEEGHDKKNEYKAVWNVDVSWYRKTDPEKRSHHDKKHKSILINQTQEIENSL